MSKKVTALRSAVQVGSHMVTPASDGTLRYADASKGDDLGEYEVALTRKGLQQVLKAVPIIQKLEEMEKLKTKLEALVCEESDLGTVQFTDDDDYPCVKVGCTTVYPDELFNSLKALGIKY